MCILKDRFKKNVYTNVMREILLDYHIMGLIDPILVLYIYYNCQPLQTLSSHGVLQFGASIQNYR